MLSFGLRVGLLDADLTGAAGGVQGSGDLLLVEACLVGGGILLSIGVLGEYIASIFEEVKGRPHFIRHSIIRDGEVRDAPEDKHVSFLQENIVAVAPRQ